MPKIKKPYKGKSTFYVGPAAEDEVETDEETHEFHELTNFEPSLEPKLLKDELVISKAEKVLKVNAYTSRTGETGHLYCTNFRICFVTASPSEENEEGDTIGHKFIGSNDIVLSNISAIYQTSGDKMKRLTVGKLPPTAKGIQIHTKSVGIHCYSFLFTDKKDSGNVVAAILTHAFPARHDLLYAHEFSRAISSASNGDVTQEQSANSGNGEKLVEQWRPSRHTTRQECEKELNRLGAESYWRVSEINEHFSIAPSMPEYFAVPTTVNDRQLTEAVSQFTGSRLPMWCYTHDNGYSLVSMSALSPETVHVNVEKRGETYTSGRLVQAVNDAQPPGKPNRPREEAKVDLNKRIATVSEIQTSFVKLCAICTPETATDFHASDHSVYSQLESSGWLRLVRSCLHTSKDVSHKIRKGICSVIIKEETSTDLSCLVSSLVQIMLDKSSRTIRGFQNILQRCWVSAGHPFCERLAVLQTQDGVVAPTFLLFLDCVYQLTVQYPSAFEFSETYLISLWDSCVTGLFREFIFNCNKERRPTKPVYTDHGSLRYSPASLDALPSVWSWDLQFGSGYLTMFLNPLYKFANMEQPNASPVMPPRKVLKPNCHRSQIEVWIGFFYRNTAPMQIVNGGKTAEYFQQCVIMQEITELQNQLAKLNSDSIRTSGLYFESSSETTVNEMLAKLKSSYITSTFPFNNRINRNASDISLCALVQKSQVLSDHVDDEDSYSSERVTS